MGAFRGRPLAVEVKCRETVAKKYAGKEPRRPAQIAWQAAWEAAGGVYLLVQDVDELAAWVLSLTA